MRSEKDFDLVEKTMLQAARNRVTQLITAYYKQDEKLNAAEMDFLHQSRPDTGARLQKADAAVGKAWEAWQEAEADLAELENCLKNRGGS